MYSRSRFPPVANTHRPRLLADTKLEELELPEEPVLELLNSVSMAKRMANMVRPAYRALSGSFTES